MIKPSNAFYLVAVVLLMSLFSQCGPRQTEQVRQEIIKSKFADQYLLDTTIIKKIPLTIKDEWATIYYHLKVKDWKKPVEWTFDIISGKDTVYSMASNEAWLDSNFYDFGYVPLAPDTTYLGQKKFWYLQGIINCQTHEIGVTEHSTISKEQQYCSKYWTTKDDTVKIQKNVYWGDFWNHYKNKPILAYSFYCHPCDNPGLMAYYPRLRKMVLIAHD